MKDIAIYTLTSELHDEQAVDAVTRTFLESLDIDSQLRGSDYTDYGTHDLNLIYVRTGGTEAIFKRLVETGNIGTTQPVHLLTSGKSNSLAASMEILSWLRQQGIGGEILHGSAEYIHRRITLLAQAGRVRRQLQGCRLGIIGQPSDWLIASHADKDAVKSQLGIELVDIAMDEVLCLRGERREERGERNDDGEERYDIYRALRQIIERHRLQGFTLRCFDLLTALHDTGCMALARLNSEGLVAGCEGDVPAMLSMMIVRALLGVSGFQANPASIGVETGEMVFAHCTIPLDMVERYELDTHFESGIGTGIRGYMKTGPVTVFKVSGDLKRWFVAEGELLRNEAKPDLCRTQQVIRLNDPQQAQYFLTNPIGNHHIIMPGQHREVIEEIFREA